MIEVTEFLENTWYLYIKLKAMNKVLLVSSFAFLFLQCGNKVVQQKSSSKDFAMVSSDSLNSYAAVMKKLLMKNVSAQCEKADPNLVMVGRNSGHFYVLKTLSGSPPAKTINIAVIMSRSSIAMRLLAVLYPKLFTFL